MTDKDPDTVRREFDEVVNMTARELEDWLATEESRSVGQSPAEGDESTGHFMGRRIVEIREKKTADLDDDDLSAMAKVHGYVQRHRKQEPTKQDVATSRWRYSLMNWGHDPLK